jgi:ArsR family transcriptional regulator, virulence genes transcriptional regulator
MTTEPLPSELSISTVTLREATRIFRAINNPLRQRILQLAHLNKRLTVTEIYKRLNIELSVASQHLAILRSARIVKTERQSKFTFYSVNYERLEFIDAYAKKLLGYPVCLSVLVASIRFY